MRARVNLLADEYKISIEKAAGEETAHVGANANSALALIYGLTEIIKYCAARLGISSTELLCRITTTLLLKEEE